MDEVQGTARALATVFDVFISYNRADRVAVKELATLLTDNQIRVWLDEWNLVPGEAWQPEIEKILQKCRSIAVVAGPSGLSAWQREEMRAAIVRRVSETKELVRVIPILLPGTGRRMLEEVPFLSATTWVQFSGSVRSDKEELNRLICGIRGIAPGPWPTEAKAPTRYYFIADGTIDQIHQPKVEALIEKLRQYSGDATLSLKEIKKGSVILVIEGDLIGFERLEFLFKTGQLSTLLGDESGFKVEDLHRADDSQQQSLVAG